MSVTVICELNFKPEGLEPALAGFEDLLVDTRTRKGFESIELVQNTNEKTNLVLYESGPPERTMGPTSHGGPNAAKWRHWRQASQLHPPSAITTQSSADQLSVDRPATSPRAKTPTIGLPTRKEITCRT